MIAEIADDDIRLIEIDTRLAVLTWMAGTNLALTAGLLWRLLAHYDAIAQAFYYRLR